MAKAAPTNAELNALPEPAAKLALLVERGILTEADAKEIKKRRAAIFAARAEDAARRKLLGS